MTWIFILGLALSSSLDNLGVGISYGIRKIRISLFSNSIISIVCFLFSFSGILFGKWISTVIPGILPILISVFILFAIGFRIVWLSIPRKQQNEEKESKELKGFSAILQNPESVDFDKSKDIGIIEAFVLGVALSTNALVNGLSAGLLGYSPLVISLAAAIGSFLAVWIGAKLGQKAADIQIGSFKLGQFGTLISGILLMLIAFKFFF